MKSGRLTIAICVTGCAVGAAAAIGAPIPNPYVNGAWAFLLGVLAGNLIHVTCHVIENRRRIRHLENTDGYKTFTRLVDKQDDETDANG